MSGNTPPASTSMIPYLMALNASSGSDQSLFGLSPEQINAINGRDIERGQLANQTVHTLHSMGISDATLAADQNAKDAAIAAELALRPHKIAAEQANVIQSLMAANKSSAEAGKVPFEIDKIKADINKINLDASKTPLEKQKLIAETVASYASAGASNRAGYQKDIGLNPTTGKYEHVVFAAGKPTFTGVEATPKDINVASSGKLDDTMIKLQNAINESMYTVTGSGNNKVQKPRPMIDAQYIKSLNEVARQRGKAVLVARLDPVEVPGKLYGTNDLERVEIPILVDPQSKISTDDIRNIIARTLMSVHGYSQEDAVAQAKTWNPPRK